MKTATLKKPSGEKFQVNDRRKKKPQLNLQILKGSIDTEAKPEPLMPTGYGAYGPTPPKTVAEVKQDQRDEKRPEMVRSKRPTAGDEEPLYPMGIEIED